MIKLIRFLLTGSLHEHEWEEVDYRDTDYVFNDADRYPQKTIRTYIYKCKKCGIHKNKRLHV